VNAVTRVITEPGTVIRLGRRVGVVLDATLVDVRVVAAGGTETWPLADIATSTATDTGTAYLVRALDHADAIEVGAPRREHPARCRGRRSPSALRRRPCPTSRSSSTKWEAS